MHAREPQQGVNALSFELVEYGTIHAHARSSANLKERNSVLLQGTIHAHARSSAAGVEVYSRHRLQAGTLVLL